MFVKGDHHPQAYARLVVDGVRKLDNDLNHLWENFDFRKKRIVNANTFHHINAIVTLITNGFLFVMLVTAIRLSNGVLSDTDTNLLMLPLYGQFLVKLICQLISLFGASYNAYQRECKHKIFNFYDELSIAVPVLEHMIPVVTYLMYLLSAVSLGNCVLHTPSTGYEGFCRRMDFHVIQAIIATATAVKVFHNLFAIYNHYHHTSALRNKQGLVQEEDGFDSIERDLGNSEKRLDKFLMNQYQFAHFWKYQLGKIWSNVLVNNLCRAVDYLVDGIQIIVLVGAFQQAKGNLHNVSDWSDKLLPLQLCFFSKAILVLFVCIFVFIRTLRENNVAYIKELMLPSSWYDVAEHILPFVAYTTFGIMTIVFGNCFLTPGQGSCKAFSFDLTQIVVVAMLVIQLLYHARCIEVVNIHTRRWKKADEGHQELKPLEEHPMTSTKSIDAASSVYYR